MLPKHYLCKVSCLAETVGGNHYQHSTSRITGPTLWGLKLVSGTLALRHWIHSPNANQSWYWQFLVCFAFSEEKGHNVYIW